MNLDVGLDMISICVCIGFDVDLVLDLHLGVDLDLDVSWIRFGFEFGLRHGQTTYAVRAPPNPNHLHTVIHMSLEPPLAITE